VGPAVGSKAWWGLAFGGQQAMIREDALGGIDRDDPLGMEEKLRLHREGFPLRGIGQNDHQLSTN